MKVKRKKGFFSISAVAKMFSVHQQTIRLYEKQGLIVPKRSEGNTRLFSEDDINRLEEIIYLTHEVGINLAGVEMILKLKKQITKMQRELNTVFENTQKELDKQAQESQNAIRTNAQRIMHMRQKQLGNTAIPPMPSAQDPKSDEQLDIADGNWEIEYEE